nr:unnamed protein product [Callosobruchus chinensis]
MQHALLEEWEIISQEGIRHLILGRIVGLREAMMSFREIGNRIGRNATTVMQCWREWSINRRHSRGTGTLNRTTDREECLLRFSALRDRFSLLSAIGHAWRGLWATVIPLTNRHRYLRLTWCQKYALWNQEWDLVVFSDESRFCLWARGRVR